MLLRFSKREPSTPMAKAVLAEVRKFEREADRFERMVKRGG
jgi:hypothetical protein